MKKILMALVLVFGMTWHCVAQIGFKTAYKINGQWSRWESWNYSSWSYRYTDFVVGFYYKPKAKIMTGMYFEKSGTKVLSFKLPYIKYPRKTLREHLASGEYYTYSGTVEYYVWEDHPTIENILEWAAFPRVPPTNQKSIKRTAKATIKIKPYRYRNGPHVFYLYFDDVVLAISFVDWPFDEKYIR